MQPPLLFFLISVTLLHCHCLAAQVSSKNTLNQGDSLNSSSELVSPNTNFTLGFYTPENTNNTYLAVWITSHFSSPVWIGNRENPVHPKSNPILTIDDVGNLIINHTGGEPVPVYSSVLIRKNLSATLLDSGNFVVSEMMSSILWQSFDYPTDTFLPGMKLLGSNINRTITSWFNETNASAGAFTMEWDPVVAQLLIRRRGVVYWASGQMRDYYDEIDGYTFKGFENFEVYFNFTNVTNGGGDEYLTYTLIGKHFIRDRYFVGEGLRLSYDGSINYTLGGMITPISNCYGYETKRSPLTQGCQLWHQPSCRNNRQTFVQRIGFFVPSDAWSYFALNISSDNDSSSSPSDCREVCWNDCECFAYNYGSDGCQFVRGRNLKFQQNLDGTASPMYIIITAPPGKGMKTSVEIILGVLSAMVVLSLGTTFFILQKLQQEKREVALHQLLTLDGCTDDNGRGSTNHDLRPFTYSSIKSATHNFSSRNKLGQGGFGPVYKGKTSEGKYIAVKLLSRQSGQGLLEFKTKLILISKLQHVNLVKLIGFCVHKDDKMIIYDYMPNKSLDFFLFNWSKRFSIIEGIAQGLLYLHKYSRLKIIHRDLKPSNILLDRNMIPKISDFGLARIFKQDISEANTHRRVGTIGYMAPEYAMQGIFSVKSDVYSFGVLILEIVSGRKNNSFHDIEGPLSLMEYAWELWNKEHVLEIMDPTLRDSCAIEQLQRCIHIGLLCVENHAVDRPTSEDVVLMLKNEMTNLPMPKCPAFITRNSVIEEVDQCMPEKSSSANEITLSEIGGR